MLKKLLLLLFVPFLVQAEDYRDSEVLFFDERPLGIEALYFPTDKEVVPYDSDFQLVEYATMSDDLGTRCAVITLQNTSTANRILEDKQVVATLANGKRVYAKNLGERISSLDRQSVTACFGLSKFPIVKIEMR